MRCLQTGKAQGSDAMNTDLEARAAQGGKLVITIRLEIRKRGTPFSDVQAIKLPGVPREGDYIEIDPDSAAVRVDTVFWIANKNEALVRVIA
jgi:hypothetical protein